jgi:Protein of unknown function (DUF3990)
MLQDGMEHLHDEALLRFGECGKTRTPTKSKVRNLCEKTMSRLVEIVRMAVPMFTALGCRPRANLPCDGVHAMSGSQARTPTAFKREDRDTHYSLMRGKDRDTHYSPPSPADAGLVRRKKLGHPQNKKPEIHSKRQCRDWLKADFGAGFYTTTNLRQASEWAAKRFGDSADVLHFSVSRRELAKFSSKSFGPGQIDEAFAMYKVGRSGGKHGYDVMSGPMLRNPIPFMRGAAAVMKGQQTSFHTQSVIDLLNGSLVR